MAYAHSTVDSDKARMGSRLTPYAAFDQSRRSATRRVLIWDSPLILKDGIHRRRRENTLSPSRHLRFIRTLDSITDFLRNPAKLQRQESPPVARSASEHGFGVRPAARSRLERICSNCDVNLWPRTDERGQGY